MLADDGAKAVATMLAAAEEEGSPSQARGCVGLTSVNIDQVRILQFIRIIIRFNSILIRHICDHQGRVLRFYCSWNDTAMFGRKHNLKLFYYLCDDTTFIAAPSDLHSSPLI